MIPSTSAATFSTLDLSRIAQDLQIRKVHVENVVHLLDEGNTVPFITRYRKERTGGLNEDVIRRIQTRVKQLRQLAERKQTILKSIEGQGKLTDELRQAILEAESPKRLEDLYLPYKPKKRSLASEAREKGLEPLALAIWGNDPAVANLTEVLTSMVNPEKQLNTPEEVLAGVKTILAETVSELANLRGELRRLIWDSAHISSTKAEGLPEGRGQEYKGYFEFKESVQTIPPHRILAINRGEKEGALKVRIDYDPERVKTVAHQVLPLTDHAHRDMLLEVVDDAVSKLVLPSIEREVRRELTELSLEHAAQILRAIFAVCCFNRLCAASEFWESIPVCAPAANWRSSTRPEICSNMPSFTRTRSTSATRNFEGPKRDCAGRTSSQAPAFRDRSRQRHGLPRDGKGGGGIDRGFGSPAARGHSADDSGTESRGSRGFPGSARARGGGARRRNSGAELQPAVGSCAASRSSCRGGANPCCERAGAGADRAIADRSCFGGRTGGGVARACNAG